MNSISQIAIIGSTASGKTALSIKLAHKIDAYILSLDSLAIYKDINIASAKPNLLERDGRKHFGIDYLLPNEKFDVHTYIKLYHDTYQKCIQDKKNLIIVGGTSFYLKMLIDGISNIPEISKETLIDAQKYLLDLEKTYQWLYSLDPAYMINISSSDSYRIEKMLTLYLETKLIPSEYFRQNPAVSIVVNPLFIYQITWDRDILRDRIKKRTHNMIKDGLINEVCNLEKTYTRSPNSMKSIGIKETLGYLDGIYDKNQLIEKIITNTSRLAKRQNTFNNSQFTRVTKGSLEELEGLIL